MINGINFHRFSLSISIYRNETLKNYHFSYYPFHFSEPLAFEK